VTVINKLKLHVPKMFTDPRQSD